MTFLEELAGDLSLFMQVSTVERKDRMATILFKAWYEKEERHVHIHLLGFEGDVEQSDFTLKESAFTHLRILLDEIDRIKKGRKDGD